jgi:hypothetical protein
MTSRENMTNVSLCNDLNRMNQPIEGDTGQESEDNKSCQASLRAMLAALALALARARLERAPATARRRSSR